MPEEEIRKGMEQIAVGKDDIPEKGYFYLAQQLSLTIQQVSALDRKVERLESKIDTKADSLEGKIDNKIDRLENKLDKMVSRLDGMKSWFIGIIVTIILGIINIIAAMFF